MSTFVRLKEFLSSSGNLNTHPRILDKDMAYDLKVRAAKGDAFSQYQGVDRSKEALLVETEKYDEVISKVLLTDNVKDTFSLYVGKLPEPEDVLWSLVDLDLEPKLYMTWDPVAKASGYKLTLFRKTNPPTLVATVLTDGSNLIDDKCYFDFTSTILGAVPGDYMVKIQALGYATLLKDSDVAESDDFNVPA